MYKFTRIILILSSISIIFCQTPEELKRFMDTYNKLKVDQQANEIVKKGVEDEKDPEERPVRLLVDPKDIADYYYEKMNVIKEDLLVLDKMLSFSDTLPPISYFGYDYFTKRDSIFLIDNSAIPRDYVLGYGDEVIFSIWGQVEQYEKLTLQRDGSVYVKNVGLLYLGGKTVLEAEQYSRKRFSQVYSTIASDPPLTQFDLSLGKIKNININVSGKVRYPGNYVVNPNLGLPNLLILAGGIEVTGSLRNILLQRNGSIIDSLDLYPMITGLGVIKSIKLLNGDRIIVPSRMKSIAVTGSVLTPAYYESNNYESVSTILSYAGGIDRNGTNNVLIVRQGDSNKFLNEDRFKTFITIPGDSLVVPTQMINHQTFSISSNSHSISKLPWVENMTVSDLIKLLSMDLNTIKSIELSKRENNSTFYDPETITPPFDDIIINPYSHINFHLKQSIGPTNYVVLRGEVFNEGDLPLISYNENLNSIIKRGGGILSSSNMNMVEIKRDTLYFGSPSGEIILMPGDSIFVNRAQGLVKVHGEVHNPGLFEWKANLKAKDYIRLAGGLTAYGDKNHITYISPYGEASRITLFKKNMKVLDGGTIYISEKSIQDVNQDRFQQVSSLVSSLVSIALLATTVSR